MSSPAKKQQKGEGKKSAPKQPSAGSKKQQDSDFDESEDDEDEDGLLPEDVSPIHYALHLRTKYEDFTFQARVVILLKITAETDQIQFNSADLVIDSASLATASKGVLTPTRILEDEEEEVITLRFDEPLQIGEATLTILYHGKVSEKMNGLYKTEYLHQGVTQTILLTQFEACDARRVLPCWDEPARKATFGVTLVTPAKYTTLSNMPMLSATQIEGGEWNETTFQHTPIMSTYLLAFAIGEFESIQTTTKNGTLIRLLTPLGKIDQGAFSLELGKQCVEFYSDYFSLDYPLPKLDLLAVPDIAIVAMENWGLCTFGETALLVHPTESSLQGKQYVALLVAHEIAHQWFGNIVTMEWWTDLWLNEGFASWMEYFCISTLHPDWSIWDSYLSQHYTYTFSADSLVNSHPVEVEIENPEDIDEIFDAISYSKGSCVIRMIQAYLGDAEFRKGLTQYLKKYSYANAVTANLWEELSSSSGKNVKEMMSQWALQTGFPCVIVKSIKHESNGSVTLDLSQRRFLLTGAQEKEQTKWTLPISVVVPGETASGAASSSSAQQQQQPPLLTERDSKLTIQLPSQASNQPFKLNSGQVYLYRVLYPLSHYPLLKSSLFSSPVSDRLGIQNDLFAFFRCGSLPWTIVAEFIEEYCTHETNENVWADIATNILDLASLLQFNESASAKFSAWIQHLLFLVWKRIGGWEYRGKFEGENTLRARLLRLLVTFGHEGILKESCQRFYRFISKEHVPVSVLPVPSITDPSQQPIDPDLLPPDLRDGVYSAVVSSGGLLGFQIMLERFHQLTRSSSGTREEIVKCLHSLSQSKDKSLLSQALTLALDDPLVRVEDASGLLYAVACNPSGTHLFWSFVKERWTKIVENFEGAFCLPKIVGALSQFNAESQAAEVATFYKRNKAPTAERAVKQTIERIQSNSKFLAREEKKIVQDIANRLTKFKLSAVTAASASSSSSLSK